MVKIKKRNYSLKGFSKFRNKKIKTRKQNIKRGGMVNEEQEETITNIINDYNNIMDRSLIDDENNIYSIVMAREAREAPYQYKDVEMVNQKILQIENRIEEVGSLMGRIYIVTEVISRTVQNIRSYLDTLNQQISRVEKNMSSIDYLLSERERLLEEWEKKKYLSDRQIYWSEREGLTFDRNHMRNILRRNEELLEMLKQREREVDEHLTRLIRVTHTLKDLLPIPEPEPEPEPEYETKDGDDDSQNGGKKNKKNKRKKSIKRKGKKV